MNNAKYPPTCSVFSKNYHNYVYAPELERHQKALQKNLYVIVEVFLLFKKEIRKRYFQLNLYSLYLSSIQFLFIF